MSLNKQIFLYSISTDDFYNSEEQFFHKRLLRLYIAKNKNKSEWRKKWINKLIKQEKRKLTCLLDAKKNSDIVRELNIKSLKEKNIISLFESSLTRTMNITTNSLTKDLFIVDVYFFQVFKNLVKNGFLYNNEKYIFLTASAGQIRTKESVFIKEKIYNKISLTLMCGLTIEKINEKGGINPNKFLSYLALSNSATDPWNDFDIDKSIVVEDFETNVQGEVDYIDSKTYKITRQEKEVKIPHTDGCGIMLNGPTRMIRAPFIKGLLITFPFDKFIKEKCKNGTCIIKDIYGKEYDILADGIEYIFTKSQFKLYKYYSSWQEYKDNFKKYNCEVCYCNIEENYIPKSRINYQMLQTLTDITSNEINYLIKNTIKEINSIGNDFQTSMRLLGATKNNINPSWFQQALILYPELIRDPYCRDILKQTKISLVKQAKAGRLRVNGGYYFVSPDLYAFCEWLFLGIKNPKGILQKGEVYCKDFKDNKKLACLRSPHLYREWPIRINNKNTEIEYWFGNTKCIYTSCHDLISKILQFD